MDSNRKAWNERHKKLKLAIQNGDCDAVRDLYAIQHAMVHSQQMSQADIFSFEDEIMKGLPEQLFRKIAAGSNHSIVWILWHMARVEDVVMNMLVAGKAQVLFSGDWSGKIGIGITHTGNGISNKEERRLSKAVDIHALRAYRMAVGLKTRQVIRSLRPKNLKSKVDPLRLQRIWDEGAILPTAKSIVEYWGSRTIGGLLLMPPLRHCFLHLNEARRIRQVLVKSRI
jgi:hypothetical protein